MKSKECLEHICELCEDGGICSLRVIEDDYCKEYKEIEKELEILEMIRTASSDIFELPSGGWHYSVFLKNEDGQKLLDWLHSKSKYADYWEHQKKHKDFDAYGQQQCEGDCGC